MHRHTDKLLMSASELERKLRHADPQLQIKLIGLVGKLRLIATSQLTELLELGEVMATEAQIITALISVNTDLSNQLATAQGNTKSNDDLAAEKQAEAIPAVAAILAGSSTPVTPTTPVTPVTPVSPADPVTGLPLTPTT